MVAGRTLWLLLLAALGGALLVVVAVARWSIPADEHAYWLAARRLIEGEPLYDLTVSITTPYAYLYPPPLAQILVPVAAVVPSWLFSVGWIVLMLVALWWLAGRDVIRALALVAFLPVAVEFWFRNVNLFLAVVLVLGFWRSSSFFAIGAAVKFSPGFGIPYLALRGRWRAAIVATVIGLGILVVSLVLSPQAWAQYVDLLRTLDPGQQSAFIAIPFAARAATAAIIVLIASRLDQQRGDVLFVGAATLALPSLWFAGLSVLVAAVPLIRRPVAPATTIGHVDVSSRR